MFVNRFSCMGWFLLMFLALPMIHAQDAVSLVNPPSSIPASGTFTINVQYTATSNRAIVADILLKPNFSWYGQGWISVGAGSGTKSITVTVQNNPTPGTSYVINLWEVDSNIWNNGANTNAWQSSSVTPTKYDVSLVIVVTTAQPTTTSTITPTTPAGVPTSSNPTIAPTPSPSTFPSLPTVDPFGSNRTCTVSNSDVMVCSGCGYTICRNYVALYQICSVGACNSLTQQCDATLPKCLNPQSPGNGATPQHMIGWSMVVVLLVTIGTWIL